MERQGRQHLPTLFAILLQSYTTAGPESFQQVCCIAHMTSAKLVPSCSILVFSYIDMCLSYTCFDILRVVLVRKVLMGQQSYPTQWCNALLILQTYSLPFSTGGPWQGETCLQSKNVCGVRRVNHAVRHVRWETLKRPKTSQPFHSLTFALLAPCSATRS